MNSRPDFKGELRANRESGQCVPEETSQPKELTDQELLSRVVAGDTRAFEQLYWRYVRLVACLARACLRDRSAAEDLTQEVFIRLWRNPPRELERPSLAPWLATTTRNLCTDEMRTLWARATCVSLSDAGDDLPPSPESDSFDGDVLERCLASISKEEHRKAFVLRYGVGLSFKAISEVLQVNEATCKVWVFRARKELRENKGRLL